MKEWALEYATKGVAIIPLKPGAKFPPLTEHGSLDATTDLKTIEAWWNKFPDANIGLLPGELIILYLKTQIGTTTKGKTALTLCDS